jgi:hypothetical protein
MNTVERMIAIWLSKGAEIEQEIGEHRIVADCPSPCADRARHRCCG